MADIVGFVRDGDSESLLNIFGYSIESVSDIIDTVNAILDEGKGVPASDENADVKFSVGYTEDNKPVAVVRSQSTPTRVVVIVSLTNPQNGNQVIAPFEIDGSGRQNNICIDTNAITTIFGKSNALVQMKNAIETDSNNDNKLFYWDKKEAVSLLQRAGLQLSGGLPQDGFIHSIRDKGSKVKWKFNNVTETKQFKRWFGDWENNPKKASKVVNDDGTPKIVYHGSPQEGISVFNASENGALGKGIYFSESEDFAKGYTIKNGTFSGETYKAFLNISKPYIANYAGGIDTDVLIKQGYDGVYSPHTKIWVVFNPNQIKSATDNIGTFDGENDDIRFQASKIVSKKEQMRKDDRLQLDNLVMQNQAPYIADNLPLPKMQGDYTNNYYVIWYNIDHGRYSLFKAIPVEGNDDLIMEHRRKLRNGTDGIAGSVDARVERARAQRRQHSGDNVDGDTDRHGGRADRLSSGQPGSEGGRYSGSNDKNPQYQRRRVAKYDTRTVDEKEIDRLKHEVERLSKKNEYLKAETKVSADGTRRVEASWLKPITDELSSSTGTSLSKRAIAKGLRDAYEGIINNPKDFNSYDSIVKPFFDLANDIVENTCA